MNGEAINAVRERKSRRRIGLSTEVVNTFHETSTQVYLSPSKPPALVPQHPVTEIGSHMAYY